MKTVMLIFAVLTNSFMSVLNGQTVNQITSREAAAMIRIDKKIVVLDVRTKEEFKAGHIKGAVNIDMKQADFQKNIDKLDRNARYIVHCRTNNRSTVAANWMRHNGFKIIYIISDGFTGWKNNGLPVE